MSIDLCDCETQAAAAVRTFWQTRTAARARQAEVGRSDQGERSGVTAGKNMDGFLSLLEQVVRRNGLDQADICLRRRVLTLPGFFRPTKLWDLLVIHDARLVAAVELKSQVGPSFGNHFNNRAEEAIGTATDLWTAYREGAFGASHKPFVGWLMLLEDEPASRAAVAASSPHFPLLPGFAASSYAQRYETLCRKLMLEGLYSSAALLVAPRTAEGTKVYSELSAMTGLRSFVAGLAGHVAAEAARS